MAGKLTDKEYAIRELTQNHYDYSHLPETLQADRDVAIAAINKDTALHVLYHLPKLLRADQSIARHTALEMEKVQTQAFIHDTIQANFATAIAQMLQPGKKASDCFPPDLDSHRAEHAFKASPLPAVKPTPRVPKSTKQSI